MNTKKSVGWVRREFVTPGADPTVVVQWRHGEIVLEEFQASYSVNLPVGRATDWVMNDAAREAVNLLGESLHKALERIHDIEQEQNDLARAEAETEMADYPGPLPAAGGPEELVDAVSAAAPDWTVEDGDTVLNYLAGPQSPAHWDTLTPTQQWMVRAWARWDGK